MAETLLFNLPAPSQNEEAAVSISWYQSDDGLTWDNTPVDTVLVVNLITDPGTGKLKWESQLANESRYHQLKTVSLSGTENPTGYIVPPRPIVDPDNIQSPILGTRIQSGVSVFKIGDIVELLLDIDLDAVDLLDETIDVHILDIFNNLIKIIQANRVGETLYSAEYKIPSNISLLFNPFKEAYDSEYLVFKDRWITPGSTGLEFTFNVDPSPKEQAVVNNAIFELLVSDVVATDNSVLPSTKIRFTSNLTPFYCSVDDVIDVHKEYMSEQDHFDIIDQIVDFSKNLDMHLKPDVIIYPERFLNAAKNWVAYTVAYNFLSAGPLDITSESKSLNNFSVSKTYDRDMHSGIHRNIREYLDYFQNIVLAGGNDTPFTTKTFIKGIFDLKRPRTNRSSLDISDFYPWVNTSTTNTVITLADGRAVEVEGTRTIGFRMRLGTYGGGLSVNGTSLNSHATFSSQGSWSEQQETMY